MISSTTPSMAHSSGRWATLDLSHPYSSSGPPRTGATNTKKMAQTPKLWSPMQTSALIFPQPPLHSKMSTSAEPTKTTQTPQEARPGTLMPVQSPLATFRYSRTRQMTWQCILTVWVPSLMSTSPRIHPWWTLCKSIQANTGNARTPWESTTSTKTTLWIPTQVTGGHLASHLKLAMLGICYLLLTLRQKTTAPN